MNPRKLLGFPRKKNWGLKRTAVFTPWDRCALWSVLWRPDHYIPHSEISRKLDPNYSLSRCTLKMLVASCLSFSMTFTISALKTEDHKCQGALVCVAMSHSSDNICFQTHCPLQEPDRSIWNTPLLLSQAGGWHGPFSWQTWHFRARRFLLNLMFSLLMSQDAVIWYIIFFLISNVKMGC